MKIRFSYSPFEAYVPFKNLDSNAYVPSLVHGLRKASEEEYSWAFPPAEDLVAIYVF